MIELQLRPSLKVEDNDDDNQKMFATSPTLGANCNRGPLGLKKDTGSLSYIICLWFKNHPVKKHKYNLMTWSIHIVFVINFTGIIIIFQCYNM